MGVSCGDAKRDANMSPVCTGGKVTRASYQDDGEIGGDDKREETLECVYLEVPETGCAYGPSPETRPMRFCHLGNVLLKGERRK